MKADRPGATNTRPALTHTRECARVKAYRFRSLLIGLVNDETHVWHAGRHRFPARFCVRLLLSQNAVPSFKQGPQ
jgi:hypothetical protein